MFYFIISEWKVKLIFFLDRKFIIIIIVIIKLQNN